MIPGVGGRGGGRTGRADGSRDECDELFCNGERYLSVSVRYALYLSLFSLLFCFGFFFVFFLVFETVLSDADAALMQRDE